MAWAGVPSLTCEGLRKYSQLTFRSIQISQAGDLGRVVAKLQVCPRDEIDEADMGIESLRHLATSDLVEVCARYAFKGLAPLEVAVTHEGHRLVRGDRPGYVVEGQGVATEGVVVAHEGRGAEVA